MSETIGILVLYGKALGLSLSEMEKISADAGIITEGMDNNVPEEVINAAAGERDPKILWRGAIIYGYLLDAYTVGGVEQEVSP